MSAKFSALDTIGLEFPNGRTVNVTLFQLLQWKHALALESQGLRVSRGRSVSAHVKELFGLKKSLRVAKVAALVAEIHDDIAAQRAA